jgi:dTDP-glucose 4,6-dehydratase|tara:strand:- start:976 stop:1974 length:999 start_codon:yes stop_codon:yes gene_type:complete
MKVLVTGGMGFIGSNFIRHILSNYDNIQITNIDKLSLGSNIENLKDIDVDRYRFVRGDIADFRLVKTLMKDVDAIVNVAAETHVDRSISNPMLFLESNTIGTFALLEEARKADISTFLQVSTDEVHGTTPKDIFFDEVDSLNPSNPYSASKAAADMFVTSYHKTYGLKTMITRCTNNFGPYQSPEKFLPKIVIRAILNLKIPIYGTGQQIRDWIYVNDHCKAVDLVLRKGKAGETYNISAGNELKNVTVAEKILNLLEKPNDLIEFVEDRPGHDARYSLNSTKIRSQLGWTPQYNFENGLKTIVDWYTENEGWWKPLASEKTLHPTPWKLKW